MTNFVALGHFLLSLIPHFGFDWLLLFARFQISKIWIPENQFLIIQIDLEISKFRNPLKVGFLGTLDFHKVRIPLTPI